MQNEIELYHYSFCVLSRKIRIILSEKMINANLINVKFWNLQSPLYSLCPLGTIPVLVDKNKQIVADSLVISEYLEENYPSVNLMGRSKADRIEIRRLESFAAGALYYDAVYPIIYEKTLKLNFDSTPPDSKILRRSYAKLDIYLEYLAYLSERRKWLAGDVFSVADISIAAAISSVDYLGDINWQRHLELKNWYVKIKSRPSFRSILTDVLPNIRASAHYINLDF